MKKWIAIILVVIFAAYGGVSFYFSNKLFFPPLMGDEELKAEYGTISPEEVELTVEEVSFPARDNGFSGINGFDDKVNIHAWWIEAKVKSKAKAKVKGTDTPKRAFILVHGRNSNKKALIRFASLFVSKGISTLLIDLRGHGESTDNFVTFGDKERYDVMGAVDYLSTKGYGPDDKIGLLGLSMGATSSFLATMDLNIEKDGSVDVLIFDSGIPDVPASIVFNSKKAVGDAVPFLLPGALVMARLRSGANFKDGNPIAHTDDINIPILFVIHEMDELIPYDEQKNLFEEYPGPKQILEFEGLGHHRGHVEKRAEYEDAVNKFLKQFNF